MRDGFIKVAAVTPKVVVADPVENTIRIKAAVMEAAANGAKVIVCPELCITGYTCGDLFLQETLLRSARERLVWLAKELGALDAVVFVGLPLMHEGKLYNVAAALNKGEIIGIVPKTHIPNYNEFYEARYFSPGKEEAEGVDIAPAYHVPMGSHILFQCDDVLPELVIGVEICEDVWTPNPPSISHALAGATLIVNLSASDETTGKDIYRRELVAGQSARLLCGYIYASAGDGESTQDVVYSGHNIIAENGVVLAESERFTNETVYSEIDMERLVSERRRMSTFAAGSRSEDYLRFSFFIDKSDTTLSRFVDPAPFVPGNKGKRDKRCEEILAIQSMGLKKRLEHTRCKCAVVGISGGLDSTLALLVTVQAFDRLKLPREQIYAVTMPGFGTTDRTYENALSLIRCLGAKLIEVDIKEAVRIHFRDIGQDESVHDVTYENGQARERTQILMDIANKN